MGSVVNMLPEKLKSVKAVDSAKELGNPDKKLKEKLIVSRLVKENSGRFFKLLCEKEICCSFFKFEKRRREFFK